MIAWIKENGIFGWLTPIEIWIDARMNYEWFSHHSGQIIVIVLLIAAILAIIINCVDNGKEDK